MCRTTQCPRSVQKQNNKVVGLVPLTTLVVRLQRSGRVLPRFYVRDQLDSVPRKVMSLRQILGDSG